MNENTELLNREVYINQTDFERTIQFYKNQSKEANKLAEQYEAFGFGTFTKEAFIDLVRNGGQAFKALYNERTDKQIQKLGISSPTIKENLTKQAKNDLNSFLSASYDFAELFARLASTALAGGLPLAVESIRFENGRAVVSDEMISDIRRGFAVRLETAEHVELYDIFTKMKELHDRGSEIIKQLNPGMDMLPQDSHDLSALLFIDADRKLQFDGSQIKWM